MTLAEPSVIFENRNGVLEVSLNRTDVLNAINIRLLEELQSGLKACLDNPEIKVLKLYGRGRSFASGADIEELAGLDETGIRNFHQLREGTFALLESLHFPTMAIIHGYALGTGLELALSCDFRIAGAEAKFGVPSAKLGIAESYEYISRLVSAVGPSRARKLLLTGERIDSATAFNFGLVDEIVKEDELFSRAETLAAEIAKNSSQSMVESKKVVSLLAKNANLLSVPDKAATMVKSMRSSDFREGVTAFLEKRRPKFIPR